MEATKELSHLEQMLREAGEQLRRFSNHKSLQVSYKSDDSLVTEADLASERSILSNISQMFPGEKVLSEEENSRLDVRHEGDWVWVVDPLDGTTNFANNYPFYCVSIARCEVSANKKLIPKLGGVYDPVRDKLYLAELSKGASCNGAPMGVRQTKDAKDAFWSQVFLSQGRGSRRRREAVS